jgi:hypothetical protein
MSPWVWQVRKADGDGDDCDDMSVVWTIPRVGGGKGRRSQIDH